MTRIAFWNVRHLGGGTDDDRKKAIKTVFEGINADYVLFAELTTTSVYPPAQNLTYRRKKPKQLCYGCLDSNDQNVNLQKYIPESTPEYEQAAFKGGNDFKQLANRAVGYLGQTDHGVYVYVIHAPATNSDAKQAISFVACHFDAIYDHHVPWLLIGDFNVEPSQLETAQVGIQLSDLILATTNEYTYLGPKKNKLYDYALCNFVNNARIARIRCSPRLHGSDHYPIVVEF